VPIDLTAGVEDRAIGAHHQRPSHVQCAAQRTIEQARLFNEGGAQVDSAMGRKGLEQQYVDAGHSMGAVIDQLRTSLSKGADHSGRVVGNSSTSDRSVAIWGPRPC
jgi:hypothetical protein